MNKFFLSLLTCLFLVAAAYAAPGPCPATSYDVYAGNNGSGQGTGNGFSCTINSLLFTNFLYSTSSPSFTPVTSVQVAPQNAPFFEGFQFVDSWTASAGGTLSEDSLVSFSVISTQGKTLTDLHLFFNGSSANGGAATVTEQFCLGSSTGVQPCSGAGLVAGNISVTNPGTTFDASTFFAPVSAISVSKDISVSATTANGSSAHISQVVNNFSSIPEPMSFVLLGTGLLGLGLLRKRLS